MRVIKHVFMPSGISFWSVVAGDEYIVSLSPTYCTCPDFLVRVMKGKPQPCKHIRAVAKAASRGEYEIVFGWDEELRHMMLSFLDEGAE